MRNFNSMGECTRVMIVENDRGRLEALAALIRGTPDFACSGEFRCVEDALRARAGHDVILLDLDKGVPLLAEKFPQARIVMHTALEGTEDVFESIRNGACGYLLKKTPASKLIEAISEARNGGSPMTPEIATKVVDLLRRFAPPPTEDFHLTSREQEVLVLLADGFSYIAIGARLGISANTVRNYIRTIYEKLQVHSRSEAVSKALRQRMI